MFDAVYTACSQATKRLHREVQPVILTWKEWAEDSAFLRQVRSSPVLNVVGELESVETPG